MAFDWFAVTSYGAYPTPTPTNTRRSGLAVSMGLLNFAFPTPPIITTLSGIIIPMISNMITKFKTLIAGEEP